MKTLVFTGGHHTSALAVAKALTRQGLTIVWLGHRHSLWGDENDSAEYREVTAAGIKFIDLKAGKFYRTFHPLKLIRLPLGFIQSFLLLLSLRPAGIVSFGGYLAVPVVISGWLLGIPSITHEQTITAGWANRAISPFVKRIALTWPQSLTYFPKHKSVLTGLPLRPEILKLKRQMTTNHPKKPPLTLYVTGGKQGSHVLNQAIFTALPQLVKKYRLIIHQTGFKDLASSLQFDYSNYEVFDFDSQKAITALGSSDVVVSRAGAHISYELAVLGKRSVLIPIPWVSHNEQYQNAQFLASSGLAIVLDQSNLTPSSLQSAIHQAQALSPRPLPLPTNGLHRLIDLVKKELVE